ncbi:hypothetical protein V7152_26705 [Neobacillus drentensis]|uniref:hypothetical protein n=1 Tax=Neobacillus drentensis TaxID=220684 RepID=UPI003000A400
MDEHLQQIFDIRFLKIGQIINSGVLQIGCGSGGAKRVSHVGYTTVGPKLVPLQFAVPLQAARRPKL